MRKILIYLLLLFSVNSYAQTTSIYSYKMQSAFGTEIDFANFKGKKILIVNTGSASENAGQVQKLNELCQRFEDSNLIVIIFPSNDFAHEPKADTALAAMYSGLHTNLYIATKGAVSGSGASPIYHWLSQFAMNGVTSVNITADFQKVLISKTGSIVSIIAGKVSPVDVTVTDAIYAY